MTKIEWCDITINPIVGCTKISAGCQNCYAEKMAWRLKCMGIPKYQDVVDKNGWTGNIGVDMSVFHKLPFKEKKVFVVSMGDLFHDHVALDMLNLIYWAMREYPWHTYILLTKRPERMAGVVGRWTQNGKYINPNVWLGVTAENQKRADERIPILLQVPAAVRFISVEPMLAPVEFDQFWSVLGVGIDWVIAGPETGPGARPCKPEWIASLYEQCQDAGVPFFDKSKNYIVREFPERNG